MAAMDVELEKPNSFPRSRAAKRPTAALGLDDDEELTRIMEESPLTKKTRTSPSATQAAGGVVAVTVVEERIPLTFNEALEGAFAGLTAIHEAPVWLSQALEHNSVSARQLLGRHVAYASTHMQTCNMSSMHRTSPLHIPRPCYPQRYHWEGEWGWAVGRLGASSKPDSNFAVLCTFKHWH